MEVPFLAGWYGRWRARGVSRRLDFPEDVFREQTVLFYLTGTTIWTILQLHYVLNDSESGGRQQTHMIKTLILVEPTESGRSENIVFRSGHFHCIQHGWLLFNATFFIWIGPLSLCAETRLLPSTAMFKEHHRPP